MNHLGLIRETQMFAHSAVECVQAFAIYFLGVSFGLNDTALLYKQFMQWSQKAMLN